MRVAYLLVALLSYALRRMLQRSDGVVVLCYHSILPRQRDAFDRQMRYVMNRAVPLPRVESAVDGDACVVVTFDDAFECLLENALPVIRARNIPIAVFAVSGNLGPAPAWLAGTGHPDADLPIMTPSQLQLLSQDTHCLIGSHSASHQRLGLLSLDDASKELLTSKQQLEGLLGVPCDYLALPHGSYRPEVIETALRQGYKKVLTLDEISRPSSWPRGTVGRFSVSPDMWMIEFVLTVHGAYAWLREWRIWIRAVRGCLPRFRHAG